MSIFASRTDSADDPAIYAVGLLSDIKRKRVRYALRGYVRTQIKARNWRALRNYLNGYLYEPEPFPVGVTECGHGWTRRRAVRSLQRNVRAAAGGVS